MIAQRDVSCGAVLRGTCTGCVRGVVFMAEACADRCYKLHPARNRAGCERREEGKRETDPVSSSRSRRIIGSAGFRSKG
eukprot:767214-Hanusia_phi.AAC.3